jgi:hypothetical protein
MINEEDNDRSNYGDEKAINIKARYARCVKKTCEDKAAYERADDPQDNVKHQPFPGLINEFASNKARNQSQHNPRNNTHLTLPFGEPRGPPYSQKCRKPAVGSSRRPPAVIDFTSAAAAALEGVYRAINAIAAEVALSAFS